MEAIKDVSNATETLVSDEPQQKLNDTVSYETHKKLLGQRKKDLERFGAMEAELQSFKDAKSKTEEDALVAQGKFKEALEIQKTENTRLIGLQEENDRKMLTAHKLNAFRSKLPGEMRSNKYYEFVDVDSIQLDPDSGVATDQSVDEAINKFMGEHQALVRPRESKRLPDNAPLDTNLGPKPIMQMDNVEKSSLMQNAIKQLGVKPQ